MSIDPYLGEISMSPLHMIPKGWAVCDGRLLSVATNQALFALIGNRYGGDGTTNFALPDLRGRVPIGAGKIPNSGIILKPGAQGGAEAVVLTQAELPAHRHDFNATTAVGTTADVQDGLFATVSVSPSFNPAPPIYGPAANSLVTIEATTIQPSGGGHPHNNIQPSLVIGYIIAIAGMYPSTS